MNNEHDCVKGISLNEIVDRLIKFFINTLKNDNTGELWFDSKRLLADAIICYLTNQIKIMEKNGINNGLAQTCQYMCAFFDGLGNIRSHTLLESYKQQLIDTSRNLEIKAIVQCGVYGDDYDIRSGVSKICICYLDLMLPTGEYCMCMWRSYIQREMIELYLSGNISKIDRFNIDMDIYDIKLVSELSFKRMCAHLFEISDLETLKQIATFVRYIKKC